MGVFPLGETQGSGYHSQVRVDVVTLLPRPLGRVLDVGCGTGANKSVLRDAGATWIEGIELAPAAAQAASKVYDAVHCGDASELVGNLSSHFDTILCYDVLEHLYDPLALLRSLRDVASPGARLHISVPNARHVSLLRDLIVRGTFGYEPFGHRDVTHLRWFTRRDMQSLVQEAAWDVTQAKPLGLRWRSRTLAALTRGITTEYLTTQWALLATRPI